MKIKFTETGWADYLSWQTADKKTLKKINRLKETVTAALASRGD